MLRLTLMVLRKEYSIHRLPPDTEIPIQLLGRTFFSVTRTDEELSIVCESDFPIKSITEDRGWSCLKVIGPLDLNLTGIIANIASVLAVADINIFVLSTYDTDYLLVKTEKIERAKTALREAKYRVL